jgi:AcrR family transcriptional regulator
MYHTDPYLIVKGVSEWHYGRVPVERLTPERRRQLTRDALVTAAAEVFNRKGFNGASLDEIAEAAGFTRGAIYSNFGSKEELLFAVIDHFDEMGLAGIAEAMEAETDGDPTSAAIAAATKWPNAFTSSPEILALGLELRLYALRNPEARKRLALLERQVSEKLASFIEDNIPQSLARDRARELADLGRAAVTGLQQVAAIDEERSDYYRGLVSWLFVLLSKVVTEPQEGLDDAEASS